MSGAAFTTNTIGASVQVPAGLIKVYVLVSCTATCLHTQPPSPARHYECVKPRFLCMKKFIMENGFVIHTTSILTTPEVPEERIREALESSLNVTRLNFSYGNCDARFIAEYRQLLAAMTQLRYVSLTRMRVDPAAVKELQAICPSIERVFIEKCELTTTDPSQP